MGKSRFFSLLNFQFNNSCSSFCVLIFLILFNVYSLFAQTQKIGLPEIEFYDRKQYGAGRQNWKITQDDYGVIYFANNTGLLSFDGSRWALDKRKFLGGLKSVSYIDGKVYLGNYNEFGYINYDVDSLQHFKYTAIECDVDLKRFGDYWHSLKFNNQIVYFTEKAIVFLVNDKVDKVLSAKSRFLGMYSVNDRLLLHDKEAGLLEYKSGQMIPMAGGDFFSKKFVGAILPFSSTQFVVATLSDGLYLGDERGIHKWNIEANEILENANVFCGAIYQDENIVLGTLKQGVLIINKRGDIVAQIDKDKGLNNNTVLSLFVDKEKNIWCGLENGVAKIKTNSSLTFLSDYYDLGTGYAIELFKGYYYLGTSQGLYKISEQKFRDPLKTKSDFERMSGSVQQHWSLFVDDDEILCGSNFGILRVEGNSARLITPISINGVWCFKKSPFNPNQLLAGTYDGVALLEKRDGKWQFVAKIQGFNESARFLEWESSSTLLVAHSFNGVYRLHLNSQLNAISNIETFSFSDFPGNKNDLTLSKIGDKHLFSSFYGIYTINEGSSKPERFSAYDYFFANGPFPTAMKEDELGNIWFLFLNSVGVLRKLEDGSFKKITYPFLPLESKMVNFFQSVYVVDKDNVFFNTDDGFAHYSISDRLNYQQPFNVHITSLLSVNDSVVYSLYNNSLNGSPNQVIPHFSFRNNSIDVEYTASFYNDKNILYSCFLKGYDDEPYTSWTNKSSRNFQSLEEGTYELIVSAKNNFDVVSESAHFQFVIDPPWYRSLVAKSIYALLFVVLIYVSIEFFRRYILNLKNEVSEEHSIRFKAKEDQLLYESLMKEQAVIKFKNEQLYSEMLFKERELASLTVHVVKKNDFLSDLKEQLRRIMAIKEPGDFSRKLSNIIKKIDSDIDNENNWTAFERQFEVVHASFLSNLLEKHSTLNSREQKLCAYIKMGLSSKEIASLMNITTQAVENNRSKLRQTLGLSASDNLAKYLGSI